MENGNEKKPTKSLKDFVDGFVKEHKDDIELVGISVLATLTAVAISSKSKSKPTKKFTFLEINVGLNVS